MPLPTCTHLAVVGDAQGVRCRGECRLGRQHVGEARAGVGDHVDVKELRAPDAFVLELRFWIAICIRTGIGFAAVRRA